jgi:formamidase
MNFGLSTCFSIGLLSTLAVVTDAAAEIVVGDVSVSCAEDPACINRLHPDIPTVASADPG